MRYGPEPPLVVDGKTWKSALAIPRALWGLFFAICVVLGLFPIRFAPEPSDDHGWWLFPLVGSIAFAVSVLLPPSLAASRLRKLRPKIEPHADGSGRVFVSATDARRTFVQAALPPFITSILLGTVTVGSGVAAYLSAGQLKIGLVLVLVGIIAVAARAPSTRRWRRRAEEAYDAHFAD